MTEAYCSRCDKETPHGMTEWPEQANGDFYRCKECGTKQRLFERGRRLPSTTIEGRKHLTQIVTIVDKVRILEEQAEQALPTDKGEDVWKRAKDSHPYDRGPDCPGGSVGGAATLHFG